MTTQGQGLGTIDKERKIGAALAVSMKVANARFADRGFRYWHFDANAGSGWNESAQVEGSPVVFLRLMQTHLCGMEAHPFFCDINEDAMRDLQKRIMDLGALGSRSIFLPGDNEEGIEVFAQCLRSSGENPNYILGSILIDPNGYWYRNQNGIGAPVNSLPKLCEEFPRIDTILNLNCRTYRLQLKQRHNVVPPQDVLLSLKPYWLVSYRAVGGGHFLLAVGRSFKAGQHKSLGFYDLDSEEGQCIIKAAQFGRQHDAIERQCDMFK